jgi:hypothetical protein
MNLVMPPTNASGDPSTFPSVQPFFINFPVYTPWEGYNIQISLDPRFTTLAKNFILTASAPYFAPPHFTIWDRVDDIQGDNTYYWRVRPQYYYPVSEIAGSWSQAGRFEREGFIPQNLQESVTFATPTFTWDIVEGASSYDLQVDNDPNYGSTEVNINTDQNSYTPLINLPNATYYWRVRIHRDSLTSANDWSPSESFTLSLPIPTGLTPNGSLVHYAPTMCWNPVLATVAGTPVLAAWKYRLQVSTNPNFPSNQIFDTIDTEQTCWTPQKGYDDGLYYWRVAIILDGNNIVGDYSSAAQFTKQYPVTTLLEPPSGGSTLTTPTFVWSPVDGANRDRLEVSLFPTFSPTYDSMETNNTRYTPTKTYALGALYYWRVAIVDRDNKYGPYTNATILIGAGGDVYLPILRR